VELSLDSLYDKSFFLGQWMHPPTLVLHFSLVSGYMVPYFYIFDGEISQSIHAGNGPTGNNRLVLDTRSGVPVLCSHHQYHRTYTYDHKNHSRKWFLVGVLLLKMVLMSIYGSATSESK